jgi:hypothetical protein
VNPKIILALETSCDETGVAILRGSELLASEVASQVSEHKRYGGVVPEVASRNHLIYAPRLLERARRAAKIDISQVDAFAATSGPGLASSLMIGASIAKGLAVGFGKPYLAINHLEGHLLSPFFVASASNRCSDHGQDAPATIRPNVSLVVSGGHTMSVHVRGIGDYIVIGRTVDDAAESGAEVREETVVENVDFDQDGAMLFLRRDPLPRVLGRAEARPSENIRARYVIDASGRNSVVGNNFKLKKSYEHLQKLSLFAHYEG